MKTIPSMDGLYRVARRIGMAGLFVFALHSAGSSLGYLGGALLLISLILMLPSQWRGLRSDPVLIALGVLLAYLTYSTLAAYLRFGATYAEPILDGFRGYVEILLVAVAFGWWLARRPGALLPLLGLAVTGLVIRILMHVDWLDPVGFLATAWRPGFGMSVIHFALSASLGLVGLLVFARRIIGGPPSAAVKALAALVFTAYLAAIGVAFGLAGARIAWFGFAMAAPLCFLYMLFNRTQPMAGGRSRIILLAVICGLFLATAWVQWDPIERRLVDAVETIRLTLDLDVDEAQTRGGSFGKRYSMLMSGLDLARERPLLGWGIGAGEPLSQREEGARLEEYHLHNLYVQMVVEMGVLGTAVTAIFLTLLGHSVYRAYREGLFPSDVVVWLLLSLVVAAVWAMGDGKLWQAKVRNPFTFLFGVAMAIHFVRMEARRLRHRRGSPGSEPPHAGPAAGGGP